MLTPNPRIGSTNELFLFYLNKETAQHNDLPSMDDLIEYCQKYPRLLTLRDSPLKYLQDPNVPKVVIHDWYIYIASEYTKDKAKEIIDGWEKEYLAKKGTTLALKTFGPFVDQLYELCQRIFLAPSMPWPGYSPMTFPELKQRLYRSFCSIITSLLPATFDTLLQDYYSHVYDSLFEQCDQLDSESMTDESTTHSDSMIQAPCTHAFPYKGNALGWILTHSLDENLPEMMSVGDISNYLLEKQLTDLMNSCPPAYLVDLDDLPPDHQQKGPRTHSPAAMDTDTQPSSSTAPAPAPMESTPPSVQSDNSLSRFIDLCQKCNALKLTPPWERMIHTWISQRLENEQWARNWTTNVLAIQLDWLQKTVLPWLSHIIAPFPMVSLVDGNCSDPWFDFIRAKIKVEHILYREYYDSRSKHIFDIIMDFPTSKPVTEELMVIIQKTRLMNHLRDTIMESLNSRLLHQGASATDIIQQYISCIRLMKLMDPSCEALLPIVRQVETYMINYRDDTLNGVIEMIRQSEDYDLATTDAQDCYVFPDSELNDENITILDDSSQVERLQKKSNDPVAMLISLCGSRTKFAEKYKEAMAKSLMLSQDYDTDQEVISLELVKQHFTENIMVGSDVMIKDMSNARRVDRKVHEHLPHIDDRFHATVMSRLYWPEHPDEPNINLIPSIHSTMKSYAEEFTNVKPSRKLVWLPSQGSMTIELEFDNRSQEFTVDPPTAHVIALFEQNKVLTKRQVMDLTGLPSTLTLASLNFWHKNRVLRLDSNGLYRLLEQ
ncbi:hypothetical protein [Absidia glauca]|uniref:Cullin family profile domain-containing protein n=1 Tax=Absidia glauca TaxID=4829 RepID=A0A163L0G0_ABSGL|nr:hypothetical protein [Absidia glauca]